jgi:hypothetical protein
MIRGGWEALEPTGPERKNEALRGKSLAKVKKLWF